MRPGSTHRSRLATGLIDSGRRRPSHTRVQDDTDVARGCDSHPWCVPFWTGGPSGFQCVLYNFCRCCCIARPDPIPFAIFSRSTRPCARFSFPSPPRQLVVCPRLVHVSADSIFLTPSLGSNSSSATESTSHPGPALAQSHVLATVEAAVLARSWHGRPPHPIGAKQRGTRLWC